MSARWVLAALLALAMLLAGALAWQDRKGRDRLLAGLDPDAVARIEMAHGRQQVVMSRRMDTGDWILLSAADAPADPARIAALLEGLAAMEGRAPAPGTPAPRGEPLRLRLSDGTGAALAELAFWPGRAQRLPDGPVLAPTGKPALPLWQSAWAALTPPQVDAARIAAVERLTPEGPELLGAAETVAVAEMLAGLSATDFVAGATVSWSGARMLRVRLVDGQLIDLQQVPDGEGRYHLRLTSDTLTEVRAARRYAFRVAEALP